MAIPVADRAIELLKPPLMVVVMVEAPWLPCATVSDEGEAAIAKFAFAATTRVHLAGALESAAAVAGHRERIGPRRCVWRRS